VNRTSWRWYDVLVVLAGGALAGLLAGLFAGDPSTAGAYDADRVFWLIIPCQNLGHIGVLVLIARARRSGTLADSLGFIVEGHRWGWVLAGAASSLLLAVLAEALRSLLGVEEASPQAIVEAAQEVTSTGTMVAAVIGVGVMGPIAEELLYRGLTIRIALDRGMPAALAVVVSAAVFTVAHLADASLFSRAGAITLSVLFLFGLFLGVLRIRTGNIGASIFAHSGLNLMTLATLFFIV